ncbi:putative reverse transcriptase domain-containing protein [Tanacetum coccineum]
MNSGDIVLEALDKRQIGEDNVISSSESVYKFVLLDLSFHLINSRNGTCFLGGTTVVEVILVKGELVPSIVKVCPVGEASGVALKGAEWPTHVDIPKNDERKETPEQPDKHENSYIPASIAKEIKEMISQEIAKAQAATLSHPKEYFSSATHSSLVALDELGRGTSTSDGHAITVLFLEYLVNKVQCRELFSTHYRHLALDYQQIPKLIAETRRKAEQTAIERATAEQSSLSALENMHYSQMIRFDNAEEASMLKSLLNIYDLDCGGWWVALGIASSIGLGIYTKAELKNIQRDFLSTHQATQQLVHDFSMIFLDRACFLPEYVNDQKLLMSHYVDMLKKEICEFVSAKDWKNMDELMNAALEQEKETKKCERSPPKRRIDQGGSSSKKFKSNETYPSSGGKGYPQCTNYGKFHPGECLADVEIANSKIIHVANVFKNCEVEIDNEKFSIDLIPMPMGEINVVIDIDCLSKYDAIISCQNKLIRIRTPSGGETFIYGKRKKTSLAICTYARAKRHLACGCQAYLAHIIDTKKPTSCLDNILVVREFLDVFPEELPGIPPDRQVEFRIDLIPGTTPVAKTPYRLALSDIQELMKQLQELLDKGFILPSISPWGAPVLFLKNKDGSMRKCINARFEWGDDQEIAFEVLKQKLSQAPVLVLPEGNDNMEVYCDASLNGPDCKANVVADALSRKTRHDSLLIKSLQMVITPDFFKYIKTIQHEAWENGDVNSERLVGQVHNLVVDSRGLETRFGRIWIPNNKALKNLLLNEANKLKYSIHPGATKMNYNLKPYYWWPGMKRDIVKYVKQCLTCLQVKTKISKLKVIVDHLTRSAIFLSIKELMSSEALAELYLCEVVARHGVSVSIVSDTDNIFTSRFWQRFQKN